MAFDADGWLADHRSRLPVPWDIQTILVEEGRRHIGVRVRWADALAICGDDHPDEGEDPQEAIRVRMTTAVLASGGPAWVRRAPCVLLADDIWWIGPPWAGP